MGRGGFSRTSYLAKLSQRMCGALSTTDTQDRDRHVQALLSFQKSNGGFAGRRGDADLYYTGFAVRALHALGALEQAEPGRVYGYLSEQQADGIIDQLNLLNSLLILGEDRAERESIFDSMEGFRTSDGGYGKMRNAKSGSTYHTFLAALCYDLFGDRPPEIEQVGAFLRGQARDDGGFCDSPRARRSNTNATAAGLSTAMLLKLTDGRLAEQSAGFLLGMRHETGGWLATRSAPFPDLLSTYTALMTLDKASVLTQEIVCQAVQFAESCECENGGFKAAPVDDQADTEYTFYGLGVTALGAEKGSGTFSA